jgi:hypothetical protein
MVVVSPDEKYEVKKSQGSRMARVVGAALEPSGFSPGVSQRELWELERGFAEVELL